jgi:protease I
MPKIQDARILIICTDGVEQLELTTPRDELRKKGARVEVATPTGRPVRAWNISDWGETQPADLKVADVKPDN